MSTTNAPLFSVEETAREMNLRPIDLLWAYAKGGINGQRIPTAYRYADSVRFTPDQVAAAIQSDAIRTLAAKHVPFEGSESDPWPEWFVEPFNITGLRERFRPSAANPVPVEVVRTLFFEANPHIQPSQTTVPDHVNPVTVDVTPFISQALSKEPTLNYFQDEERLLSQYETAIAAAVFHRLKTIFDKTQGKGCYSIPLQDSGLTQYMIGNALVWLCEQLAGGETVSSMIGYRGEFIESMASLFGELSWDEEASLYNAGTVTIRYEINPYDLFPVTEVRATIGKLFDE